MTASMVMPRPEDENLIDAYMLAKRLGFSYWSIQDWAKAGKIPCVRIGRRMRFRLSEVAQVLGLRVEEVA
ncbi:MAG: helix-turn-helix domain-containing protein [Pirellulaceae bacterium]